MKYDEIWWHMIKIDKIWWNMMKYDGKNEIWMNMMKQHNISMNDTHVSISFFGQTGQNKDEHHIN